MAAVHPAPPNRPELHGPLADGRAPSSWLGDISRAKTVARRLRREGLGDDPEASYLPAGEPDGFQWHPMGHLHLPGMGPLPMPPQMMQAVFGPNGPVFGANGPLPQLPHPPPGMMPMPGGGFMMPHMMVHGVGPMPPPHMWPPMPMGLPPLPPGLMQFLGAAPPFPPWGGGHGVGGGDDDDEG